MPAISASGDNDDELIRGALLIAETPTHLAKSRISGQNWWPDLSPAGGWPETIRTMSGSRLLSRLEILWTPLMLSSLAMALNLPRASIGR